MLCCIRHPLIQAEDHQAALAQVPHLSVAQCCELRATCRAALEAGYRHVDCARVYGNEALVGEALSPWIEQHGRDSVFVTSKVWNDAHQPAAARCSSAGPSWPDGLHRSD